MQILCIGIKGKNESRNDKVYQEFKEKVGRNETGCYETNLPWKVNSPGLPTNKLESLHRLESLLKRLKKDPVLFQQYDQIIRDHLKERIIEEVCEGEPTGKEFYLPHKPVIFQSAESTFDASARENDRSPSIKGVVEVGPPLQNHMWKVLVRNQMCLVTLTGDVKQAFLQIRIRKKDRHVLRFDWI